jgi:hypothetical protein
MTFTYDLTTTLGKTRFELGDTISAQALLTDEEIGVKLAERADDILTTAADLCDILATRFAREYDFEFAGAGRGTRAKYNRSQMSKAYADRAKALRARISSGLATVETARVDGYSDDITTRAGAGGGRTGVGSHVPPSYLDDDLFA